MATKIEMPKLGLSMQEGTVVKWNFNVGDKINKGEPIVEISTDKISNVVEAPVNGYLLEIYAEEDEVVPVHQVIAVIGAKDEKIEKEEVNNVSEENNVNKNSPSGEIESQSEDVSISLDNDESGDISPVAKDYANKANINSEKVKGTGPKNRVLKRDIKKYLRNNNIELPVEEDYGTEKISPIADELIQKYQINSSEITGTGPKSRILKKDVENYLENNPELLEVDEISVEEETLDDKTSPVAAKIIEEASIDPSQIKGTGPSGRIMKEDVERYIKHQALSQSSQLNKLENKSEAITGRRKLIADKMTESSAKTAQADVSVDIDVTEFMHLFNTIDSQLDGVLNINSAIIKALVEVIAEFPELNASINKDTIEYHNHVNVGIAVDSDQGLIVPVLKNVSEKSMVEISKEIKTFAKNSRQQRISPDDLQGGTITVSNLGMYDIRSLTPIINYPEVAILGVGTIKDVAIIKNGGIFPGKEMKVTLSFDHRLIDGGPAGKALKMFKDLFEKPDKLLLK
ncbi:MAG: 2-oxo acid dehydrogenase subunit E2 [Halanaerobiales bacterium]